MPDVNALPFFFILGRPRSGTTLLRSLFDAHPAVAIPPEGTLILQCYPYWKNGFPASAGDLKRLHHILRNDPKLSAWQIPDAALITALNALPRPISFPALIRTVCSLVPSAWPKTALQAAGDKNPIHTLYAKRFERIFPDAKFIFLVRDPRDNVLSILRHYRDVPVTGLHALRWKSNLKNISKRASLKPERYHVLRYEDLTAFPEREIQKLCTFLNIPFAEEMLQFHTRTQSAENTQNPGEARNWHPGLVREINTNATGNWRKSLHPCDVDVIERLCGRWMDRFGYTHETPKSAPGFVLRMLPLMLYTHWLTFERRLNECLHGGRPRSHPPRRLLFSLVKKMYHCKTEIPGPAT